MANTTRSKTQRYSLNLSPKYAPNWSAWEVAREIICNAMDACSDYRVQAINDNCLTVWTPTIPELSEMFIIGQGSKNPGGSTIGQFGEGMKMAALVATREPEGSMKLQIPGKQVEFKFVQVLGADVLHAEVKDGPDCTGYLVSIEMPGIGFAFDGKILDNKNDGPQPKHCADEMRIFCKGIFVGAIKEPSLWDWNLNSLTINRDRSMVDPTSVKSAMAIWFEYHAEDEQIAQVMSGDKDAFEQKSGIQYTWSGSLAEKFANAFKNAFGEMAVLAEASDYHQISLAEGKGYRPIELSDAMRDKIRYMVPTPAKVLAESMDLEPITPDIYMRSSIDRLRTLDSILCAPAFSVHVYANRGETFKGQARHQDHQLWLSEQLFTPGNEQELIRTYVHEVAHLISGGAQDATLQFEHALEGMCGRLALSYLDGATAPVAGEN